MKRLIKKAISLLLAVWCIVTTGVLASASFVANDFVDKSLSNDQLASKYLSIDEFEDENQCRIKVVSNIDTLKKRLQTVKPSLSKLEVAKTLYNAYANEEMVADLPEERILEALNTTQDIEKDCYIKCDKEGIQTIVSVSDVYNDLCQSNHLTKEGSSFLLEHKDEMKQESTKSGVTWNSSNGYMRIITTTERTSGPVNNRTYYLVSAKAIWLKEPAIKIQDVLAIASTATYDNTYNNYGSFKEICEESYLSGGLIRTYTVHSTVSKNAGSNNGKIRFDFSENNGGIAIKFDMFEYTYSGSEAHNFDYSIKAFVRFRCSLYNSDANVQSAYAHKQVGIGEIGVNLVTGSVNFSLVGTMKKYYAEPVGIYY